MSCVVTQLKTSTNVGQDYGYRLPEIANGLLDCVFAHNPTCSSKAQTVRRTYIIIIIGITFGLSLEFAESQQ